MELQIRREIGHIREMLVRMATLGEEAVDAAVAAFVGTDKARAQTVLAHESEINTLELEIDKCIFECLALRAPVATDLRHLFSMQKMNKDLERIGDHAVNIAQAALNCFGLSDPAATRDIKVMASVAKGMFSDSITCFIKYDPQLALTVLERDDQVDDLNRAMTREVIDMVRRDVTTIESALELLGVSKNLERIADLSTNIAEDVVFHAQARDIKHHHGPAPEHRQDAAS